MSEAAKVTGARIEVEKRRAELIETVRELQARIKPRAFASEALDNLTGEVWDRAKNKGANMAEDAVDAVTSRPLAIGGVAAAIAMFLARGPLKDAAVKIYDGMTSKRDTKKAAAALKQKDQPAPPAPRRARAKRASSKTETVQ